MKVTQEQINELNKTIGDNVYAMDNNSELVGVKHSKKYIKQHLLDDMLDKNGNLTTRSIKFAKEILNK